MAEYRNSRTYKKLVAALRAERRPNCWLCGQPIDYSLPKEDGDSFSADHIKPWDTHPELREDYGNLAPAHLNCNKSRGKRAAPAGLGLLSREW
ncbi:HNH endonuclease [Arthrobacter phage LittleTokyo]|nr:HNH endonuclease [Arthrobacter phage LittleTokyo]